MDLSSAIEKHAEWKTKFRSAIAKQEQMDTVSISGDKHCEMGKWLHGDGRNQYGRLTCHADCLKTHAQFHAEAGKIASTINAKKYAEAEAMLNAGSPYAKVSSALSVTVIRLRKEAGL